MTVRLWLAEEVGRTRWAAVAVCDKAVVASRERGAHTRVVGLFRGEWAMVIEFNSGGGGDNAVLAMVRECGCNGAVGMGRRGGCGVEGKGKGRE